MNYSIHRCVLVNYALLGPIDSNVSGDSRKMKFHVLSGMLWINKIEKNSDSVLCFKIFA